MRYNIGVYVNQWVLSFFCNIAPKIQEESVRRIDLHLDSEDTSPEVGKSSWWSEILDVNLELMRNHENVYVEDMALPSYAVDGGQRYWDTLYNKT